ncbi:MAG: YitT family protein [Lachnospiraceae bacterium]|nr:YitT family protein [Lachnospiraceae bacterium]MCR5476173.1 YitT family protein [Lachnospiraceae bacterium]
MHHIIEKITSYLLIVAGALMASFSVICILIPNDAIDYGTAGIAIIINKLTGFNLSLCVLLVFLPFWSVGVWLLGKRFAIKALLGTAAYTVGLEIFEHIPFEINTEHFLAVAFGGAILGAGLSLILRFGGCIDGSEIFANIIVNLVERKTGKNFSMTSILILFNAGVYLTVFVLINRNAAMMSLLVYVVATAVINHFTDHFEAIKQVTIITKHPEKLIAQIKDELGKTCTIMDSRGAIAGENKTLICYVTYFELQKMREIISANKGTFSTVSTVDEILR